MRPRNLLVRWARYRLFPYERELARREVKALLVPVRTSETPEGLRVVSARYQAAKRLTYFQTVEHAGKSERTQQALLENHAEVEVLPRRQMTRYSTHGLHDYRGKFNPQVARALFNILGLKSGARVLDPFCGSGTTLLECVHLGLCGVGVDMNPLAVVVANAKVLLMRSDPERLARIGEQFARTIARTAGASRLESDARCAYLERWFPRGTLLQLETLRHRIAEAPPAYRSILEVVASDLLRGISLQDPGDLRIRRRKDRPPRCDVGRLFCEALAPIVARAAAAQRVLGPSKGSARAVLCDVSDGLQLKGALAGERSFAAAVTSPPYATALPYIDTQRLSLVWLGLLDASSIPELQASLIGSREYAGREGSSWVKALESNLEGLPDDLHRLCLQLHTAARGTDGFRRKAVGSLLYRYLTGMAAALRTVRGHLRLGGTFALIVGHNHTVLGGRRFDIDSPELLAVLARTRGYAVSEKFPLQTYQRYSVHRRNAVTQETLLLLEAT